MYVNIRDYLYHAIRYSNVSHLYKNEEEGRLYILESILKTGYIVNNDECKKYDVIPSNNIYLDNEESPRISLGFYPTDQETYLLSKRNCIEYYGENIVDNIAKENGISTDLVDEYLMNVYLLNNYLLSNDYAWDCFYKNTVILLLSKDILKDLHISDYGMLVDEICVDDNIDARKYLRYVAVTDTNMVDSVRELLSKYDYDIPIINFPSGEIIRGKVLERGTYGR